VTSHSQELTLRHYNEREGLQIIRVMCTRHRVGCGLIMTMKERRQGQCNHAITTSSWRITCAIT